MIISTTLLKYRRILLILFVLLNSSNLYPKNPQISLSVENLNINMLFNADRYILMVAAVTQLHETVNQKKIYSLQI